MILKSSSDGSNDRKEVPTVKPMVLAVVGPTASGKTSLGVALAEALNGEVISADSMQIYEQMDIATAKPTAAEMRGIPHHLIGFVPVGASFSVAQYKTLCYRCIEDVLSRGKTPILVGGTGLYFDAVLRNTSFFEDANTDARDALSQQYDTEGGEAMLERLRQIDPEAAGKLHAKDKKRILRALEVYASTGKTLTKQNELSHAEDAPYRFCVIGLCAEDRAFLYDRINRRVDLMVQDGLLDEAKSFFSLPFAGTVRQAIGYKELKPYFDGSLPLEEALDHLKMETRRYAKRQLTWFRRYASIHWLPIDRLSAQELLRESLRFIQNETGLCPGKGGTL